jgi:CBS domain-containing protein
MPTASRIVEAKGGDVVALPPHATVLEAAQLMNDEHVGSVVVLQDARIVGIFTERDVLRRVVAAQRNPSRTLLREVMTTPVACCGMATTLDELRLVMRERRIRHVPVVDDREQLQGIVSIGDLNRAESAVQEQTIQYLSQYVATT